MRSVLIVLIFVFASTLAKADTVVYRYTTSEDVISFVGDADRIPEAYEDSVEVLVLPPLSSYYKYTHVATPKAEE